MKPAEAKKGHVIRWNKDLWRIHDIYYQSRGNLRSYYQIELKNLKTGRVIPNRFSTHDDMEYVEVERKPMQYLYRDGTHYCFMDNDSYEQTMLAAETVGDAVNYLTENTDVLLVYTEGVPTSVDLPASVVLRITDCDPGVKGDTVSNVTKPATLETGLVVKVPLHINKGDLVKVDTRTGEFLERAQSK